jgi:hypothetical protein
MFYSWAKGLRAINVNGIVVSLVHSNASEPALYGLAGQETSKVSSACIGKVLYKHT